MKKITRRSFLQRTSAAGLAGSLAGSRLTAAESAEASAPAPKPTPPSEQIGLAFIGLGGRGQHHLEWFLRHDDVRCAALCDAFQEHLDAASAKVESLKGAKAKTFTDFREVLAMPGVDAIVCATPPHWHPLISVEACKAGKDVYCEKPMCFTPAEGAAMTAAARKHERITQIGTQIHAGDNYHHVVDIVRSGILGKVSRVHCVLGLNEAPDGIGKQPDSPPPQGLDWDMWLGPAPELPYNQTIFEAGRHRYVKELIGSWLHEMGPHIVDLAVWGMDMGAPKSAAAQGGKYAIDDMSTIPDTLDVMWDMGDYMMTWSNQCASSFGLEFNLGGKGITRRLGVAFQGVNGTLWANYNDWGLYVEGDRIDEADIPAAPERTWAGHEREFLDSIRSRELCSCDFAYHARVHTLLNLGQLSYDLGRKLAYDAGAMAIKGDPEATGRLQPNYRAPWKLEA